jgi:hypothetical protein
MWICLNGAYVQYIARPMAGGGWEVLCIDPVIGEFRPTSKDTVFVWMEAEGDCVRVEVALAYMAVEEAEKAG